MSALPAGSKAPGFRLPALDGSQLALADALRRGPVVAAFFKITCPTCQYAFPFLERLHRALPAGKVSVLGISQDPPESTAAFLREYGITFPVLLDDVRTYPVSNSYGLTHVPSVFLISPEGRIELLSEGWSRAEFDDLHRRVAGAAGAPPAALFVPGEQVLDFKAG